MVSGFVERLSLPSLRYDAVAEAWQELLPSNLRAHCRLAGLRDGCLTVVADDPTYVCEVRLCKPVLLDELRRLCPAARIRRIDVRIGRP